MESNLADRVGRNRARHGVQHDLALLRREVERLVDLGIDLVEHLNVGNRAVAVVSHGDRECHAVARGGILLDLDRQIDDDRFDGQRFFRARRLLAHAHGVFDDGREGHVLLAHRVGDFDALALAREQVGRGQTDALHALLGVVELQPAHVELGIVIDRVRHSEGLARAHTGGARACRHGQLRRNKPLHAHLRIRLAVVHNRRGRPALPVKHELGLRP